MQDRKVSGVLIGPERMGGRVQKKTPGDDQFDNFRIPTGR